MSKTSDIDYAPTDGAVEETVEMFQTKYNKSFGHDDHHDSDDERRRGQPENQQVILPSGWGKRLKKPGPVYRYTKAEILEYNEMLFMHGPETTKAWADRRFNERKK